MTTQAAAEPRFHWRDLVKSLRSQLCPSCGEGKKRAQTLCRNCYFALPSEMRVRLYDRVGEGYEQAFEKAMDHLGVRAPYFEEVI